MHMIVLAVAAALISTSPAVRAHDTWFQPLAGPLAGPDLALGTGNRFPVLETGVDGSYLRLQGCRAGTGVAGLPLRKLRNEAQALVLRPPPRATVCWAQLVPLDIELTADKVAVYLQEIEAPGAVREQWQQLQQRGLPWRERYTKHARIDLIASAPGSRADAAAGAGSPGVQPQATPMAMDIVRQAADRPGWSFQVLLRGQPLAGQAMELVSEAATRGLWRLTDAQGRVEWPALPAGRWLLRGTRVQLSSDDPTRWDSDFVTLAFEVPGVAQAGINRAAR